MDEILRYYKRADQADEVIGESLRDSEGEEVVYGARSINARVPSFLEKFTRDWDVYSINAEQTAKGIEQALDRHFKGDFFEVRPAKHMGTFRVVSKVTGENAADITVPEGKVTYQTIDGIKYATLDEHVENIKAALANPTYAFRHVRDRETLQRIRLFRRHYEGVHKTKKVAFKGPPRKKRKRREGGLAQILAEFKS